MPVPLAAIAWGATLAPLVKPAVRLGVNLVKNAIRKRGAVARPGIGSPVTKGPLKVGKTTLMGGSRPGVGTVLRVGAGAAAVGVGTVASHRSSRTATRSQPSPRRSSPASTATETRKCCPVGTKRMVCFKRGRVKPRKRSERGDAREAKGPRKVSAKQRAARARFAAAARRGAIRKGSKL